jgi:aquaporin Z
MFGRRKIAALAVEFIGTYLLATAVLSMVTKTQFAFFVAVAAGGTLALVSLALGQFSGAHLNPAVTLGLWTLRKIQTSQAVVYVAIQLLAGYVAFRVSQAMLGVQLQNIAGQNVDWRIICAEALGAFVLGLAVATVVDRRVEGAKLAGTVGLALALGILVASLGGNALLNPAVAIGVHSTSVSYAVGPLIGSIVGMNLYTFLFAPLDKPAKSRR